MKPTRGSLCPSPLMFSTLVGLILLARGVSADGIFLPSQALGDAGRPSASAQKAVLIREGTEEVLLLQTTYQGPSAAFAWVVPIPVVPTEVFDAEPLFLDEVFRETNPRVVTHISADEGAVGRTKSAGEGGVEGGSGAAPGAAGVTLHQRLEVGDYDASVLSASGSDALTAWLQKNGYQVPDGAAAALQPYVERGFAFVAVRFLTGVAESKPVVTSVAPLGVRFAAEKLFFPLRISRGSAPALTSILLCVISDGPVDCETIPSVWLDSAPKRLGKGETYGAVRRESARADGAPRLLCEYSGTEGLAHDDLSYRAERWADPSLSTGLPDRHATRFFALLRADEMEDLWFVPAPERPSDYRVLLERTGRIGAPAFTAYMAWRKADWERQRAEPLEPTSESAFPTIPAVPDPAALSTDRKGESAGARRALVVGLSALVVAGVVVVLIRRRRMPLAILMLLVAGGLIPRVGLAGGGSDELRELDQELEVLDGAVRKFLADTGGYPRALRDLAATSAPAEGLDVSGNAVPLKGTWKGPYLHGLPPDLLGGELTYDVLNLRPVDLGGWSTTVCGATREEVDQAWAKARGPRKPWEGPEQPQQTGRPRFWNGFRPPEVANHEKYAAWLAGRDSRPLLVGMARRETSHGGGPVDSVAAYTTVVADPARGESFTLGPSTLAVSPETGAALAAHDYAYTGPATTGGLTGLFATTAEGALARAVPRPLHQRVSRGAVSREGALTAAWDGANAGPLLVRASGGQFREVARGRFVEAGFSPDGSALFALGWLQPAYERIQGNWYRLGSSRQPEGRSGRRAVADLIRVPLDGSEPKVAYSPLDLDIFSVSEQGVLVYDADGKLLLAPLDWGPPVEMPVADGKIPWDARAFDGGIVTIVVPAVIATPPPGVPQAAAWLGQALVQRRPGAEPRQVASLRLSSRNEAGIVGLARDGAVTLAWHADVRETARWVVKTIAADGSAEVLGNQASPEVSYGEPAWDDKEGVTPTDGATLP